MNRHATLRWRNASALLAVALFHPPAFAQTDVEVAVVQPVPGSNAPGAPEPAALPSCQPLSGKPEALGSYNRANLAAMVEDLEDLCTGRPMTAADALTVQKRNDAAAIKAETATVPQSPMGMR